MEEIPKEQSLDEKRKKFQENLEKTFVGKKITGVEIKDGHIYLKCEDGRGLQIELSQVDEGDLAEITVNGVGLENFNAAERYQ